MVKDPLCDGVDAQAVQHAEADLRMALEHEPLRAGEWPWLAEDLLGDRKLAEIVQAARKPRELDVLLVEAEVGGDARGQLGDTG